MAHVDEKRGLLKDQAYKTLKGLILDGTIEPGTFLSERQLSARLAMSKTPILAALARLDSEGFVTISPQQGIMVRELTLREIIDHYGIRLALEPYIVRNLAGNLSEAHLAQLEATLRQQHEFVSAQDITGYMRTDGEFHLTLCQFLGNEEILRVMRHQREKLHRVVQEIMRREIRWLTTSHDEHWAIFNALLINDPGLAAAKAEYHLESGKRFLLAIK